MAESSNNAPRNRVFDLRFSTSCGGCFLGVLCGSFSVPFPGHFGGAFLGVLFGSFLFLFVVTLGVLFGGPVCRLAPASVPSCAPLVLLRARRRARNPPPMSEYLRSPKKEPNHTLEGTHTQDRERQRDRETERQRYRHRETEGQRDKGKERQRDRDRETE